MKMRSRSRSVGGRRRRRRRGRGKAWNWIKGAAGKVNNFLKSSKIISKVAPVLGSVGIPYMDKVANIAGSAGYGKRRGRRGTMPAALAAYWAKRRGRSASTGGRRRRRRRGRGQSMSGRGFWTTPTIGNYPYSTSFAMPRGLGAT